MGQDGSRAVWPANKRLRLVIAGLSLLMLAAGQQYSAMASAPTATYIPGLDQTWVPKRHPHEIENEYGYVYTPAPHFTTAPSSSVNNDPHWRSPNVRANTDSTTFAHFSPAGPQTVAVGVPFTLDLLVNSGSNLASAQQSYLTFTNSILQNVQVGQFTCVVTGTITADTTSFDAVLQNEVCNGDNPCDFGRIIDPPASISFASGALNNAPTSGDFRVAQVAFCGMATGDAVIHWQFSPPAPPNRDRNIVDDSSNTVSNPTLYAYYLVHIVPAATATATNTQVVAQLVGHVTLQGRGTQPNPRQSVPVTLTLRLQSGGPDSEYSTTTDASGFFTVTAPSAGIFSYRVKNSQTLANSGGGLLLSGGMTQVEMGTLLQGDANNDNCDGLVDFNIVKSAFGKSQGQPGYDARADFS